MGRKCTVSLPGGDRGVAMNGNLTKVAWRCKQCGEITYHPSAKKDDPNLEIRITTYCLKCMREGYE